MPPIRVALIGLSANAITTWAASAHLPYLLSPLGLKHYTIVALLNSNISAAEAARTAFHLPSTVKPYGSPDALAHDPSIDLVVCCTRVDIHYTTILPSILAGKAVFVEWPLAENLSRAVELTGGVNARNSIIGLQGRVSPVTLRLKQLLADGAIGRVLSSHVSSYGTLLPRDALPEGMEYFASRAYGGNPIIIENGHSLDWVHEVLGEYAEFESRMQVQRADVKILGEGGEVLRTVRTDVPDLLSIQGVLEERAGEGGVVKGALLTHGFRHGTPFKGRPGLMWSINGEKGEILVTMGEKFLFLEDGVTIEVHDHATDKVTRVEWDWAGWQKELPVKARGVAELYERYAEWVEGGQGDVEKGREWPTLDDAVVRTRQLETIFKQYGVAERRRGSSTV
ncbi:oxidoreductase family protein [Bimuria novae-zelandiae CBS 107.79]|uniref:Oxidoreductase family protein n=1 Tax=Bimuria novae-zelandiae CBS 107.79 TaxID=1447943 RepID=A0A6A5VKB9_9PLEO|nr:oxidoreductase family protein [Bimuria novae-zelandiae CBS 107.79]